LLLWLLMLVGWLVDVRGWLFVTEMRVRIITNKKKSC